MGIALRKLTKRFGEEVTVDNVSLDVANGELFVLLGSSGSGKSTLLRLIAGLLSPDSGTIELDGSDVTQLPPQQRGVGFVFQHYAIFPHMTVAANVEFGLRVRGVPKQERIERREELLELVGLIGLADRYPAQLSGGQRQRVAVARALAYKPKVLLLDEPFSALDVRIRGSLRHNLKNIQKSLRVTTILVTHDQEEAFELADRIGVLEKGELLEYGTPYDLYRNPKSEFVASFLGHGNLCVGRKEGDQIKLGTISIPFPTESPAHDDGSAVRVLFRPENVSLGTTAAGKNIFNLGDGQVVETIFTGSAVRTTIAVPALRGARAIAPAQLYGDAVVHIAALTPSDTNFQSLPIGSSVPVGIRSIHVLEPSGLSLLAYIEDSNLGKLALGCSAELATAIRGPLYLFDASDHPQNRHRRLEELVKEEQMEDVRPRLVVRGGELLSELPAALRASHCDIFLCGWDDTETGWAKRVRARMAAQVLGYGAALMLLQEGRPQFKHFLICTAAGEPGKSDIYLGGRLARRVGAGVTVLHVESDSRTVQRGRAERHLGRALSSLQGLGLAVDIALDRGAVVDAILSSADRRNSDAIVIGAPLYSQGEFRSRIILDLLRRTKLPLIIVPPQPE